MIAGRREFLIGGACAAALGGAEFLRPRNHVSLLGNRKLADAIPKAFAGWEEKDTGSIVAPQSENSLAKKLYSESVGRLYARGSDEFVMMLIAYGNTQSDTLQLHRPEVCYPAFGMEITTSAVRPFDLPGGIKVPGRDLTATNPNRTEYVSYWTRIGEELPVDGSEQRWLKLRQAFQGILPDGVLVRFSTIGDDPAAAWNMNRRFAADFIAAVAVAARPALIGTARSEQLARAIGNKPASQAG